MTKELFGFLGKAALWVAALFVFAAIFSGCSTGIEGAGFTNQGRHAKPVVCREVRPGYTRCRSE